MSKLRRLTVTLKRDVRHEAYNVSKCEVAFDVDLDEDDDLREVFEDTHADVVAMVEEMVEKEKEDFKGGLKR